MKGKEEEENGRGGLRRRGLCRHIIGKAGESRDDKH